MAPGDAYRLEREGKLAAFVGLGEGHAIGTDLSLVESFHSMGVRCLTLCRDADNPICASIADWTGNGDKGLSEFGQSVVAECNRAGMMIDVGGCSEGSLEDILDASRAPVLASRSAARVRCYKPKDPALGAIRSSAVKGGVVLVNLAPGASRRSDDLGSG